MNLRWGSVPETAGLNNTELLDNKIANSVQQK